MRLILESRFTSKFVVEPRSGCWEWQASLDGAGYGFYWLNGAMRRAHRVAYELLVGQIPDGLELDHLCLNRRCVNPEHLEPVTRSENNRRSHQLRALRTVCLRGHHLAGDNLYVAPKTGVRGCRECRAQQARESRARRRVR